MLSVFRNYRCENYQLGDVWLCPTKNNFIPEDNCPKLLAMFLAFLSGWLQWKKLGVGVIPLPLFYSDR